MPKQRVLSANEILTILQNFGFYFLRQKGSHISIRRIHSNGEVQYLRIPNHKEISKGTIHAIFEQACKYLPEKELRPYFYTS
jgi:predicted RNA binding protein YcfA (HicA-like mRNA interferase family)